MSKKLCLAILVLLLLALGSSQSFGMIWCVERDGSGDFTEIQAAVDMAFDGDTIRIGAGRYADFTEAEFGNWWIAEVDAKA